MSPGAGKKKLNIVPNAVNNTLAGVVFKLVLKACDALTNSCLQRPLRAIIEPCNWLTPAVIQFKVVLQQFDAYVPLRKQETHFETGSQLLGPSAMIDTARDRSLKVDHAIRYPCNLISENGSDVISNNLFYKTRDEWLQPS